MINFNDPKDQTPSALAVLGLLLIVGSGLALVFLKKPNQDVITRQYRKDTIELTKKSDEAKQSIADYESLIATYRWDEKEDLVTPAALSLVSKEIEQNKLKLITFRPQKSTENEALVQLPMQINIDGSFANVAKMIENLEKKDSKLALQQMQLASQEGETDQVSATMTLIAFIKKPEKPASSKSTTTTDAGRNSTTSGTATGAAPAAGAK